MGRSSERTRVLVAEDDDRFAEAVAAVLAREPDLELVGRAGNGAEALDLVESLAPDIVVMDVEMPVLDGLSATRKLRERGSRVGVVVVTGADVEAHFFAAREAGADGYLAKSGVPRDLLPVVRAISLARRDA
ncbi:MAG: response regulator [Gaiellaceae bacterium]